MPSASAVRVQIEAALSLRIPSALTPARRILRPTSLTGISSIDELLEGGLPLGMLTEMAGPECSGKTSVALSFLARLTRAGKVCAWIDASNALNPDSVAAAGVDLSRLLWVRCGVVAPAKQSSQKSFSLPEKYLIAPPVKKGLHGGGGGSHPREEQKGLSSAVSSLFQGNPVVARCAEPQQRVIREPRRFEPRPLPGAKQLERKPPADTPWTKLEQALQATDLLLQGGGFSAIVLDMGSIAPAYATRVPLATWFRYRAAAERSQASILLLSQQACAKSSAGLVLSLGINDERQDETTVFTGVEHYMEVERQRFAQTSTSPKSSNIVALKKPAQSVRGASWKSRSTWSGGRKW